VKRAWIALLWAGFGLLAALAGAGEPDPPDQDLDIPPPPPAGLRLGSEFDAETRLRLEVGYPPPDAIMRESACGLFVAGRAGLGRAAHAFDLVIAIDTSRSTIEPAHADIDGDGSIGKAELGPVGSNYEMRCSDPGDTILSAEVAAARALLKGLDPRNTRVAVVSFDGLAAEEQHWFRRRAPARTVQPLTGDFARVEGALDEVATREPEGSTHMAAAVDQAARELLGGRGARSESDPRSEKIVLFFTDGQPTLPYGPLNSADNVREVMLAARRAGTAGIRIHSFAIGREALAGPVASLELAERTGGSFTPIRHPADLIDVVGDVSFASLEEVTARSLTTGEPAQRLRLTADGSWAAFVQARAGVNRIEVRARASDGTETTRTLEVRTEKEAGAPPAVPADLLLAHNQLLEECLRTVKEVRMEAERRRAEQIRRQLRDEIERERALARERAASQRKQLRLDPDEAKQPPAP
jgi:hypothetical protein